MKFIKTKIPDIVIIEPSIFGDGRGYFLETFNKKKFEESLNEVNFVQDNESKSRKGVLRGLHFQKPPYAQAKLVRCIKGKVLDVSVDIRKGSSTYGQYVSVELSGNDKKQLFIPKGFAHGFVVLSEEAIFAYKVDNWYVPEHEGGIIWNDTDLKIDWKILENEVQLSQKDTILPTLKELKSPFQY